MGIVSCGRRLLLPIFGLALTSCYHYRVTPVNAAPADDGHSVTKHSLAWGLVQESAAEPNCQDNGAAEVVATGNVGYALIAVVTLGFWMPMDVEWKCAKDRVRVEHGLE